MYSNHVCIEMSTNSANEGFARMAVAAFIAPQDPTVAVLNEVKTAVSEAVTNCIIHGYEQEPGVVYMGLSIEDGLLRVSIRDNGTGISDIEGAREALFTSKPELERSGMGFTMMESFMDSLDINSSPGRGTEVVMTKQLKTGKQPKSMVSA